MYKIRVDKKDYLNNPFEAYNVDLKTFTMDVRKLPDVNHSVVLDYKSKLFLFLKSKIFFIIGFIIFIAFLVINSMSIDSITFSNSYEENEEISEMIKDNLYNIAGFKLLKKDINELSRQLRVMYDDFEWISIKKDGNDLFVEINKTEYYTLDSESKMEDIVASKDGIIKDYFIKDGINNVYYNKYVKKGDVLIYSNDKYYTSGIIKAEVSEYKTIRVSKKDIVSRYISYDEKKELSIFNKSIIFNKNNENCDIIIKDSFKFGFLSINTLGFYKKYEEDIIYEYDEALALSKEKIASIYDEALIVDNKLLNSYEDDEYFYFNYYIKTIENICTYRR